MHRYYQTHSERFLRLDVDFYSRTSELVALMAISTTLFLFLHTRDLNTRLREMEVRLQPDDVISANQIVSGKSLYCIYK